MIEAERIGWSEAFRGKFEVDGVPMETQILSTGNSCRNTLDRLESIFEKKGAQFSGFADTEMGWGLAVWPQQKRKATVFVISPRIKGNTLAFVCQSRIESSKPRASSDIHGVPDYPGSRVSRTVTRKETNLNLRFLRTNAQTGEIMNFYENSLGRADWQPILADRMGKGAGKSIRLYQKEDLFCCISVKSSGIDRENVVIVLVKKKQK